MTLRIAGYICSGPLDFCLFSLCPISSVLVWKQTGADYNYLESPFHLHPLRRASFCFPAFHPIYLLLFILYSAGLLSRSFWNILAGHQVFPSTFTGSHFHSLQS
ncbi:hypothetical protein I7I50_12338 [Histoplasma capsulatum G186AR]|uniref:Uncharacterized protein n=1 Tax=Ajellomyces capsulatus TaxID=5037 RepID=A0A8H7Y896_AJECA|nr:hypothetical protein I7I52_11350 [Histoplasma capsulatum]QSS70641.1 hypothetical protein I7I50_12338 [Histoplasma capsulatum G186AR]